MDKKILYISLFVFLFSLNYASAIPVLNAHGAPFTSNDTTVISYRVGMNITMSNTTFIVNATTESGVDATRWYLFQKDCVTNIKNGSLVPYGSTGLQIAVINYQATKNTAYCLTVDNASSNYHFGPKTTVNAFPYVNTDLNWTGRVYSNNVVDTVQLLTWRNIYTDSVLASTIQMSIVTPLNHTYDLNQTPIFSVNVSSITTYNGNFNLTLFINSTPYGVFNNVNITGVYNITANASLSKGSIYMWNIAANTTNQSYSNSTTPFDLAIMSGGATTLQCLIASNGCTISSINGCNYVQ